MKKLILFIGYFLYLTTSSFGQNFEQAKTALQLKNYDEADALFSQIIKQEPNNVGAIYGLARARLLGWTSYRQTEKAREDIRFKNYSLPLSQLKEAFSLSKKGQEVYRTLGANEKKSCESVGLTAGKDWIGILEGIAQISSDILIKAPYAVHYKQLASLPPYFQTEYADTTRHLREQLISQCTDFLETFKGMRTYSMVKAHRKTLLAEFMTLEGLRIEGTGAGHRYEQFCKEIDEDYSEDELGHILPQFYGAYFNWKPFTYKEDTNYQILKKLAETHNLHVRNLLCILKLHEKGVNTENEVLYKEFIVSFAGTDIGFIALQRLAEQSIISKNWEEAIKIFQSFHSYFPEKSSQINEIIDLLERPEDPIVLINVGPSINSEAKETHPVSGKSGLYFCRLQAGTGQDIFYSEGNDGKWNKAIPLAGVNTKLHEVPQSLSLSEKTLVLFGNYGSHPEYKIEMGRDAKELGNGDCYYVKKESEKFDRIHAFPNPINSFSYESGLSFVGGTGTLIWSSDREGGVQPYQPKSPPDRLFFYGREAFNTDLYISMDSQGVFTAPKSLGKQINTSYAEVMPFIAPDLQTLYFVSDGHGGFGKGDIFMSRRLDLSKWDSWSIPVNLGKSINTPFEDGFYLGSNGKVAYVSISGRKDSYGSADIYSFEIPERFRPYAYETITGKITGISTHNLTNARILCVEVPSGISLSSTKIEKDGSFILKAPAGIQLGIFVDNAPSFISSEYYDGRLSSGIERIELAGLNTSSIPKEGASFSLANVFFDFDSDRLQKYSHLELDRLAAFLIKNPQLKIRIEGHTDNKGDTAYNLSLSEKRAEAVKKYLISKGCSDSALFTKGFGETQPIDSNETVKGRSRNRRVTFSLKPITP